MKARVECSQCGCALTPYLEPVPDDFVPDWEIEDALLPRGSYWLVSDDDTPEQLHGGILIHLEDKLNLTYHPEARRHFGCCGRDGCEGPNLVCACGAEVATERSDCWTSHYIHFEPNNTRLVHEQE